MKTVLPDRQKAIVQWVSQATGINTLGVKIRLQGNDLHILCEAIECPSRWQTLSDLLKALQQTDLEALKSNDNSEQPSIYQVFVYGRKKASKRPEWCHRVFLNQLDRHLEQVNARLLQDVASQTTAIIVSNESLARKGDPEAIARYLSETLSGLGIGVRVKVKNKSQSTLNNQNRLWVLCKSIYTPDPSLIAEPVAQKLRHLKLADYQDAVIVCHVQGEGKPDWMLRIDLTPTDVMLKDWARWGDVQAITRYLNEKLVDFIKVTTSLQESTLHVFCTPAQTKDTNSAPRRGLCMKEVGAILNDIAPQGIIAATVYGQINTDAEPAWIDWLSLPASYHPALLIPTIELGTNGDEPAIVFLLERLLNPDLDWRLSCGGTKVILLRKRDLMHVMCDAPVCPNRKQVATSIIKLLRQLNMPGISGVRIYGRRAGNKEASWHYGVDFVPRQRYVPEPPPEFAATSTYVRELLPPPDEPVLRQDLTSEEVQNFVKQVVQDWGTTARKLLLATQLFQDKENPQATQHQAQYRLVALVWGTVGLLLTLQTDWVLNQLSRQPIPIVATSQVPQPPNQDTSTSFTADTTPKDNQNNQNNQTFNASAFTQTTGSEIHRRESGTATAILLAARTQSPSFNARQLDEQLALYRQRLQKNSGKPPDILIIGSSRALRGIDPVALSKALATQGYRNLDVFNFGINGATAQVVNFILRKVLQPQELPKLIIWADGARAFNSGREDNTFRSIAASPGYKSAIEKSIARGDTDSTEQSKPKVNSNDQQQNSYQAVNDWLNEKLGYLSGAYQNREQLKALLGAKLDALTGVDKNKASKSNTANPNEVEEAIQSVDFDGFLPLSTRFDPNLYYQKHPKVSGSYDNDYKGFLLGGDQDLALQEILKFTQSQKISLVFVNMPLTSEYLDPARTQFEQLFQQYMIQTASERSHFVFRDLATLFPQKNDFFSDPSHLNRYGAYEVSNKLAKDPMIPWINKK